MSAVLLSLFLPSLLLLLHTGECVPSGERLAPVDSSDKFTDIEKQLQQLQYHLSVLENGQSEGEEKDKRMPLVDMKRMPLINLKRMPLVDMKRMPLVDMKKRMPLVDMKKRMPVIEFKRDGQEADSEQGVFYDQPIQPAGTVPDKRSWQPLKRSWQPLKRNGDPLPPKFRLVLKDSDELQQKLIDAVEAHLVEDLRAAEEYGVKPAQILNDLQAKNPQRAAEQ